VTSALTVGRPPDDGEQDLALRRVAVGDAERRVGDDDARVLLHVDAADRHHGLPVLLALPTHTHTHTRLKYIFMQKLNTV